MYETTPSLPLKVKEQISALHDLAYDKPELILERLQALRPDAIGQLPMREPDVDYARCISTGNFWRWCLPQDRRDEFEDSADYTAYLENAADPGKIVLKDLARQGTVKLFDAEYSWIIPYHKVKKLSRMQLLDELQLPEQSSMPLLLLVLPCNLLVRFGCRIRQPTGFDAIHRPHLQWRPGDVPGERIDGTLLRGTVKKILWRP